MESQVEDKVVNRSSSETSISSQFICNDALAFAKEKNGLTFFLGCAQGDAPLHRLMGDSQAYNLLLRAVNNRTRERNYFRLYSDLLDGTISEDEFETELEKNEDKYVVTLDNSATRQELQEIVTLCKHILDVTSSEDVASLFSLNPIEMNRCHMMLNSAQE